jgi:hypothetical protein
MKLLPWLSLALALFAGPASADETAVAPARSFATIEVWIDSGESVLAGWQLRADFGKSDARIVGVEGGAPGAYHEPPHYDPRALNGGEIVLAALAEGNELPAGRILVAVLHVEHAPSGLPPLEISDVIGVGTDGRAVEARVVQENGAER